MASKLRRGEPHLPYRRLAEAVLAQWRAIERQLEALNPMSPEADEPKLESHGLRDDYQEVIPRRSPTTGRKRRPPLVVTSSGLSDRPL